MLYKYIAFSQIHWAEPLLDNALYFPSIQQIIEVNDKTEYETLWGSVNYFLNRMRDDFKPMYDGHFNNTRTLCLSKSKNSPYCWNEFAKNNGICLEYEFNYEKKSDVTSGDVVYENTKERNFLNYIKAKQYHPVFIKKGNPDKKDLKNFFDFLQRNQKQFKKHLENHIIKEIVFKKSKRYSREDEYRFVHIEDSKGQFEIKAKFNNGKILLNDLGLTLKRIYTNSPELVISKFPELKDLVFHHKISKN